MTSNRTHLSYALPLALLLAGCASTLPAKHTTQFSAASAGNQLSSFETSPNSAIAAVAPDATDGTHLRALLDAQIAVNWHDSVQGLAQLLASRLQVAYQPAAEAATELVQVNQGSDRTVADVIESVNTQLRHRGQLNLVQIGNAIQLEYQVQTVAPKHVQDKAESYAIPPGSAAPKVVEAVSSISQEPTESGIKDNLQEQTWSVSPADGTLLDALSRWAQQAQWQVVWEASEDLLIPAQATYTGNFRDSVRALFRSFATSLNPTFYKRNNVVRVTDVGSRTGGEQQ